MYTYYIIYIFASYILALIYVLTKGKDYPLGVKLIGFILAPIYMIFITISAALFFIVAAFMFILDDILSNF